MFGIASLTILKELSTPNIVINTKIDKITNIIKLATKGHGCNPSTKALKLKEIAKNSIGTYNRMDAIAIRSNIAILNVQNEEISKIEDEIEKLYNEVNSTLASIPGIGIVTASVILAEIGDISKFNSPDAIVAFAGLDPRVYQSGLTNVQNMNISKQGNRHLRYAIWMAAKTVVKYDDTFKEYYRKKRQYNSKTGRYEGKHHFVAIGHVCKKLIRVIYAIMQSNELYQSNYQSTN